MIHPFLLAMSLSGAPGDPLDVGQRFPALEFPMLGRAGLHSLAEFEGDKVLLVQFASW